MLEVDEKWLVYQGSIYNYVSNEFWLMSEDEWEDRVSRNEIGNAVVLARGLTKEVANKMINLAKEQ